MLDEYHNNQKVEIKPACNGTLQKSHPKSFFTYCHVNSQFRKEHVDDNPRVLQVMVFGDNHMMVEMLPRDVYDEWINSSKEV
jgi:hypothetical protein